MFTRNDKHDTQPKACNPYVQARREWEERYGSMVARETHWRLAAFLMGLIALASVGGLAWTAGQSKVIPYVVERDGDGRVTAVGRADRVTTPDQSIIRAELAQWVEDAFSVIADGAAEKRAIDRVYAHLRQGTPAQGAMNTYYAEHSPFERAQTETVSVEIHSAVPLSDKSWQVDWTERRRPRSGGAPVTRRMRGILTLQITSPTSEREILRNPLGVNIHDISWTQQL